MNPRAKLILVGVLSAIAAGAGGYFLGVNSRDGGGLSDGAAAGRARQEAGEQGRTGTVADAREKGADALAEEERRRRAMETGVDEDEIASGEAGRVSIRRILEQPGPMDRWKDMMDLAVDGDEEAVAAALEELGELPMGIDTIVGKFFLYSRYADNDPGTALEALTHLPAAELDLARASILGGWAGRAPGEAAAFLMQNVDEAGNLEGVNERMIGSVVGEWARTDPEAAFAWSIELGEKSREGALNSLLEQWAYNSPQDAAKAVAEFPPGDERKNLFQRVALRWAQKDYEAALAWAEKLPSDERGPAVGKAVESWADEAPKAAAAYLEGMEEGAPRDYAMRRTAAAWSKEEPAGAASWVMQQPDNDQRRKAMRDVMQTWAKEDSLAASEWLTVQPQGPATDSAIVSLANVVSEDDPEGAAIWSTTIANPTTRAIQIKIVANSWLKRDPEAARAWIASSITDEKMRAELLGK